MKANRFRLSKASTDRLKMIKMRTGFKTDNIIPRIGFCLSLAERSLPNPEDYDQEGKEFNRYTLLGEWDDIYVALLRENLKNKDISDDIESDYFRAHLNRGVVLASRNIKSIQDIARLVETAHADDQGLSHHSSSP